MKTAGLNVHKDTVFCAVFDGKKYWDVEVFETFTLGIRKLGDYLKESDVKRVAMEYAAPDKGTVVVIYIPA